MSRERQKKTVAVVGPPNSGKSTLFNRLTMLRQTVANYPGVTVEQRVGRLVGSKEAEVDLIDLPGIYNLMAFSEDERVANKVLTGTMPGVAVPDAVLLVVDSTHLERHLSLVPAILKVGLPTLVLLNMADLLAERGGSVDLLKLAGNLGVPVALISAVKGTGLDAVSRFIESDVNHVPQTVLPILQKGASCGQWAREVGTASAYRPPIAPAWSRRLDDVLLHKFWGPIIFVLVVLAIFQSIFSIGQSFSGLLQRLLDLTGQFAATRISAGLLQSFMVDGIWKGVSAVLVFLPQILLLFFFVGILEDSGYLARAALISDRTMQRIGLNGKSFVPLLSAYACAVPAIMAMRTIENRKDRLATIFIAPFMTCSARLPIYTLMIAAFLPDRSLLGPLLGLRATAMLALYLLGFIAALATARLLKSSILKSSSLPFALELPEYRWPTLRSLGVRLFDRTKLFLKNAGTVILLVALVLWVMAHLPLVDGRVPQLRDSAIGHLGQWMEPLIKPLGFNWKVGIGLLTSVFAREVIVGTFGTIYGTDPATRSLNLQEALRHDLSPGTAAALVVFFAFAMQCTATLAVVRRETNSWKWPILQFLYMGSLAYAAAWLTNLTVSQLWRL